MTKESLLTDQEIKISSYSCPFVNKLVTLIHLCMQEELFYLQVTTQEAQMETLE